MEEQNDYLILKEKVKLHLRDYIEEKHPDGVQLTGLDIQFKCLEHQPDNHPSMFIGHRIPQIAKCRVCHATLSIFHAHNVFENAPLYGREFVEKNLNVLAMKYGYEPVEMAALTEDQLHKMMLYDIHECACEIIRTGSSSGTEEENKGEIVHKKFCKELGISIQIAEEMGIGTVTDYNKFICKIMQSGGWTQEQVENAGIRENMFGPTFLTYAIHDTRGRCIAFAARDWRYDGRFGVKHEPLVLNDQGAVVMDANGKPIDRPKWCNSYTSVIYEKVKTLYGYKRAKTHSVDGKVYVVEGYADAAVLWSYGVDNVVCVGSTSFSPYHVQMLKEADKTIVIICLDNDEAGWKATDRVLVEGFKNIPFIKAQVLLVPETPRTDGKIDVDPDTFIKAHGKDVFLNLKPLSAFAYTISRIPDSFDSDEAKDLFVQRFIPIIMNETSAITQQQMRKVIAEKVNVPEALIREYQSNMERIHDTEKRERLKKDHRIFMRQFDDALNFDPEKAIPLASEFKDKVNNALHSDYVIKMGFQEVIEGFDAWRTERETMDMTDMYWKTGYKHWDSAIGGIQKTDTFIGVAGQPNHGKSCMLTNLTLGILNNNDLSKVMILYWTIDDTKETLYTKLAALACKVPIFKVFTFKQQPDELKSKISKAMNQIEKWIKNQNLIIKGTNIGKSGNDVKKWVDMMKEKHPDRTPLLMIDNFSNMTGPGDDMQVQKYNIEILHGMRCDGNLAIISSFELNKEGFDNRGSTKNIRGTAQTIYRLTRTISAYNDHKAHEQKHSHNPEIFWYDQQGAKRPIFEAGFGKSKSMTPGNIGGNVYYQFDETVGLLTEIGPQDRWEKFQQENNNKRLHTEVGLPTWDAIDRSLKSVTVTDLSSTVTEENSEPEMPTAPTLEEKIGVPKIGASSFDSKLSYLDDDGL